ncbi:MAG: hypothetical protein RL141_648 [Candidatus Parcubacteria bacterium]|jgi:transketolase
MRNDFVRQMLIEMERDPAIVLLTGDLGFRAFEPIRERFPDRFMNVGIAEANMVGVAAGLALTGYKPFVYSIASFASMRCYEQIRTDVCYHGLDVKIVAAGGGFNYAHQGVTHHTVEDLACMRVLPGMRVLCPGYSWEATEATRALSVSPGPAYLRLGKSPNVPYDEGRFTFQIGKGYVIRDGADGVLCVTGNVIDLALAVSDRLALAGVSLAVASFPTIKPLDESLLAAFAARVPALYTLEEHSTIGGLGGAVGEWLAESGVQGMRFRRFGFPDRFITDVGSRDYLLACAGLDPARIAAAILSDRSSSSV